MPPPSSESTRHTSISSSEPAPGGRTTTFHRIWFGDAPVPKAFERYWGAWQRQFPECRFITWRDADLAKLPLTRHRIAEAATLAGKADIARYEILYHHGGIYLDTDVMPYHPLPVETFQGQLVTCNETDSDTYCSTAFIAAPPGHPLFKGILGEIQSTTLNRRPVNEETGPVLFGRHLQRHQHTALPTATFYPYLHDEPRARTIDRDLGHTCGIHVWAGSWLAPRPRLEKARKLLLWGALQEARDILNGLEDTEASALRAMIDTLVAHRRNTLELLLRLPRSKNTELPCFDFDKIAFWMLEREPDTMVWQIGAVDSALRDPLRPAMVNFDPPALLLEPDPQRYAALCAEYARNTRAVVSAQTFSRDSAALCDGRMPEILVTSDASASQSVLDIVLGGGHKPQLIRLAADQLPPQQRQALIERLLPDYRLVRKEGDITACRQDLFKSYVVDLYLSHGVPTILGTALRVMHGAPTADPDSR